MKTPTHWILSVIHLYQAFCVTSFTLNSALWIKDTVRYPHQSVGELMIDYTALSIRQCAIQCIFETCSMFEFDTNTKSCSIYVGLKPAIGTEEYNRGPRTVFKRDSNCEISGYVRQEEVGLCYKVFTVPTTWDAAVTECQNDGAVLVMPKTVEKIEALITILNVYGIKKVWIGVNDKDEEGRMQWLDGSYFNSSLWPSIHINDHDNRYSQNPSSADCLTLRNVSKFVDSNCNQTFPYICDKPHLLPTQLEF